MTAPRVSAAISAITISSKATAHWSWSVFKWLLAPFVDSWTGLSLNRFLAILFGSAAVKGAHWKGTGVSWPDVALAVVAGSLAFGKDVFVAYLNRSAKDEK